MNKGENHFFVPWLAALLLGAYAVQAQVTPVQFPTGSASWTVTVQFHAQDESSARPIAAPPGTPTSRQTAGSGSSLVVIRKIDVTQDGNVCRSVVTYTDGTTSEVWWLKSPPWVLFDRKNPAGVGVLTNPQMMGNFRPDASMFDWVNSNTFINKVSYNAKQCDFHAKDFPPLNHRPGSNPPPVEHEAWVDSQTGLPVALDDSLALYIFTFNPPPPTPLTMPKRFNDELARIQASILKPVLLGN